MKKYEVTYCDGEVLQISAANYLEMYEIAMKHLGNRTYYFTIRTIK